MGIIKVLPKNIVDKIAAGEVVVNAASVIKELVENSLDANSKNIFILTKEGGKKLIRVIDDGCGIIRNDIPLAFRRNATSKIYEDISGISSLGFRGEALSSISYVSNVLLMTRNENERIGTKCEIVANEISQCLDIAFNVGTTIEVTDLFYNFPARRKHLANDSSETKDIIEIAEKLAISHPEVSITLVCDDRNIFSTSGNGDKYSCVVDVLGRKKASGLMPIQFENNPLRVDGFISSPNFVSTRNSQRIVILNGRYIHSDTISKSVDSIYSEFYGKTGADYIFYISLPFNMIDVNIHPAKTSIRFLNESLIMILIKQGIKDFLKDHFVIKEIVSSVKEAASNANQNYNLVFETDGIYDPLKTQVVDREKNDKSFNLENNRVGILESNSSNIFSTDGYGITAFSNKTELSNKNAHQINKEIFIQLTHMRYLGNAFGLYALIECGQDLYAIDTHAAHERVLYERYMKSYLARSVVQQELLTPVVVTLSPLEYESIRKNIVCFEDIGFKIEDFSDNSIIVRSVPYLIECNDIENKIVELVDEILKYSSNVSEISKRNELLIKKACHNAVRGAENISKEEVFALLKDLYNCDIPFTCPHGRPTIGKISEKYFMKVFERIK